MPEKEIGEIIHFYNKEMVAVVKLKDYLAIGDRIKFFHADHEFEQVVDSMEIDHKQIRMAEAGAEVAVKTDHKARANSKLYKLTP